MLICSANVTDFDEQLSAIRRTGANFHGNTREWVLFLDPAAPELSRKLSQLFALATRFGTGVTVQAPVAWAEPAAHGRA